jgi:hypothetical protein
MIAKATAAKSTAAVAAAAMSQRFFEPAAFLASF